MFKFLLNKIKLRYENPFYLVLVALFSLLILISNVIACVFSFKQKEEELLSQINLTYSQLAKEYEDVIDNFWKIYMPIYESKADMQNYQDTWGPYFDTKNHPTLDTHYRLDLQITLQRIMQRNDDIQWIILYNPERQDNYILYGSNLSLVKLSDNFPYIEQLNSGNSFMQVLGTETISYGNTKYKTFAICGGIPASIGKGSLLVGYRLDNFVGICNNSQKTLNSINYVLTNNNQIIFDYSGKYDKSLTYCAETAMKEERISFNGKKYFSTSKNCGKSTSMLSYYVSWSEYRHYCNQNTPFLLSLFLLFSVTALFIYQVMLQGIAKEVNRINTGLQIIGNNNLSYQIPTDFRQHALSEIAVSINAMTVRLKTNIGKAHYHEMKQHEAELSDLQSRFNPHFLYNSLELLRSRCELNGDYTTADLISQLATIFRGFLNTKIFIPIVDELAFSKRYLALFGANHKDQVTIRYDFDKDILQYGIMRNIFQPLIENYFIHGFDAANEENYVIFRGKSLDEHTMILSMEDNGLGMTKEEIAQLCMKLQAPIQNSQESYGLKNLHQRLQLFYGEDYGLEIEPNQNCSTGISVKMRIPKLTCEEYGKR